jgi:hypothetical protein
VHGQCVGPVGAHHSSLPKTRINRALDEILSFCSAVFGKGKSDGLDDQGLYDALRVEAVIIELQEQRRRGRPARLLPRRSCVIFPCRSVGTGVIRLTIALGQVAGEAPGRGVRIARNVAWVADFGWRTSGAERRARLTPPRTACRPKAGRLPTCRPAPVYQYLALLALADFFRRPSDARSMELRLSAWTGPDACAANRVMSHEPAGPGGVSVR